MTDKTKSKHDDGKHEKSHAEAKLHSGFTGQPNLEDPHVVLSLLEADQVVAAKSRTRFGERKLSWGVRGMLWGLRVYVVFMLVIVAISVVQALHSAH
jgi:hypothetical protein